LKFHNEPNPHRGKTVADLARKLKVDVSTISLALRDSRKVSAVMKTKIRTLATIAATFRTPCNSHVDAELGK